MREEVLCRTAEDGDREGIWQMLEPTIRGGEVYALPTDLGRDEALAYWFSEMHQVFVAEVGGSMVGTYYLRANQRGPGSHVANCGYLTAPEARGKGVASAMCGHSLQEAKSAGFRAMQFNLVVSTNAAAVALWRRMGFEIAGTLPGAFRHPRLGFVDAFVMFLSL